MSGVWYSSNKQFILEEVLFVSELFSYKLILFFRLLRKQEQKQNPGFICLMAKYFRSVNLGSNIEMNGHGLSLYRLKPRAITTFLKFNLKF